MRAAILAELNTLGPQAEDYILNAVSGSYTLEQAVEAEDRYTIVQALRKGAKDTRAGAYHALANPSLYQLLSVTGPNDLEHLASDVETGRKNSQDVTNAMGYFADQIREALRHPYC